MDLKQAKEEKLIKDVPTSENVADLIRKELSMADADLADAKDSFKSDKMKWVIEQTYYSAFHAARALMYKFRLKEIKHEGIIVFLEERVKVGKLKSEVLNNFKALKSSRESAQYDNTFSPERAKRSIEIAEDFLKEIKEALMPKTPKRNGKSFVSMLL
jgi:uncharacterized protein (UPF0332 family)